MSHKRGRRLVSQEIPPRGISRIRAVTSLLVFSVSPLPRAGHVRRLWPQTRSLSSLPLMWAALLPPVINGSFWTLCEDRSLSSLPGSGGLWDQPAISWPSAHPWALSWRPQKGMAHTHEVGLKVTMVTTVTLWGLSCLLWKNEFYQDKGPVLS